jgi:hypothetical protein
MPSKVASAAIDDTVYRSAIYVKIFPLREDF